MHQIKIDLISNSIQSILFRGELRVSPVSGKEEMYYPARKTMKKIISVSMPVTVLCLRQSFYNFRFSEEGMFLSKIYN